MAVDRARTLPTADENTTGLAPTHFHNDVDQQSEADHIDDEILDRSPERGATGDQGIDRSVAITDLRERENKQPDESQEPPVTSFLQFH